jgi:hypothetical protein
VTTFDAGSDPPVGVVKPSRIEFYVGNPPRQMLIFSGVAVPDTKSDDEDQLNWDDVTVRLGASTTEHFTYTSTVGLASIHCDDSDFNFFGNESSVERDPDTGALSLRFTTGVSGNDSALARVSYHVQVLSDPVTSLIAGTIRWPGFYGRPSDQVLQGAPMLRVEAGVYVGDPSSPFLPSTWQPLAAGVTAPAPLEAGGTWAVPYVISGAPLGHPLVVRPDPPGSNLVDRPSGYANDTDFNPQSRLVALTPQAPSAIGVDFDLLLLAPAR